jgi:hypothetical protein
LESWKYAENDVSTAFVLQLPPDMFSLLVEWSNIPSGGEINGLVHPIKDILSVGNDCQSGSII